MDNLIKFDCFYKIGRRKRVFQRFAETLQQATASFEKVLDEEFFGEAKPVAVMYSGGAGSKKLRAEGYKSAFDTQPEKVEAEYAHVTFK